MKRPNRLYSLLESATQIRGEYWLLPDGSLLHATDGGDHNHEGWVYEYIVGYYLDAVNQTKWGRRIFGENWADQYGYEYVMFRETLMNGLDEMGLDLDTCEEEIDAILVKQFGKEQVDWFYPIVSNGVDRATGRPVDAREFATRYWKWVRIAFNNAELPDLKPATLKHTGEGFCQIMFEETGEDEPNYEIELTVSTYQGQRITTNLYALLDGKTSMEVSGTPRYATYDDLTRYGRAAADKMDQQAQHPFYHGKHESILPWRRKTPLQSTNQDKVRDTGKPVDMDMVRRLTDAFRLNGFTATLKGDHFEVTHNELGKDRYGRQTINQTVSRVPADEWSVRDWLGLPH